MLLTEIIKPFLEDDLPLETLSSIPEPSKNLSDDNPIYGNQFFDNGDYLGLNPRVNNTELQANKINEYRKIAQRPEVQNALHEIINEIVFTQSNEVPLRTHVKLDSEKLQNKIQESFTKISRLMSLDKNLFQIVKQAYVDGQMVFHIQYKENKIKEGIQKITMLDPRGLVLDPTKEHYYYKDNSEYQKKNKLIYSKEEIVKIDFGLRDGDIILGYLEQVIKVSNMLQALEDMLIPMRFSRSISRRIFNVDIGDLPPKRGQAVMNEYQRKFKYKKFYDTTTGEITNNQHITSMVEDYWFQNRSGGKGTQVDLLDESGNLGELDDILYFNKKLYKALGVPVNRQNSDSERYDQTFDIGTTNFSQEEIQFFLFISRLRKVYEELFKEILKREIISTGLMTQKEYYSNEHSIKIVFSSEVIFLDKIKLHLFTEKISAFRDQMDYTGKIFSQKTQIKKIFNLTEEEIIEEMKEIQSEKNDKLFKHLYEDEY